VGQVFSDPQMSLLEVEVSATEARLSPEVALPLTGHLRSLTPGRYRLGLRAHHLRLAPASDTDVRIPARVEVEEVSGSETLVHATHGRLSLTAQVEGIHRHPYGTELDLFVSPSRVFAFSPEGRLVAAPASTSQEAVHGPH
jgi:glycerol transport system ATP-binding protein